MATYVLVLKQSPNGEWFATDPGGGRRVTNIGGWESLLDLARGDTVAWESPNSISRFRAQFGEPPADEAIQRMRVAAD